MQCVSLLIWRTFLFVHLFFICSLCFMFIYPFICLFENLTIVFIFIAQQQASHFASQMYHLKSLSSKSIDYLILDDVISDVYGYPVVAAMKLIHVLCLSGRNVTASLVSQKSLHMNCLFFVVHLLHNKHAWTILDCCWTNLTIMVFHVIPRDQS